MFFYEPIQGIQQGPGHFIAGLGQGTAALVGGTVEGAFHAPSEVTAALSQGLNSLADSGSKAGSGQHAHSTMQGLGFLAHDFGHDLSKTVTSVFVAPVKGAKKDGASGFVKGIGKGVVQTGASGAALGVDLATNLTGALGHLLSNPLGHADPDRTRLRRVAHRGGVIEHWNETRAQGQALLDAVRVHQAKHRKWTIDVRRKNGPLLDEDEYYNDHFEVADGNVLILADDHVLLIKRRDRGYVNMTARETRKQKGDKIELIWSVRVCSIKQAVRTRDAPSPHQRCVAMRCVCCWLMQSSRLPACLAAC
jgi:vacuolar protein sorting-associated protein 13A/C